MELNVIVPDNKTKMIQLSDEVFNRDFNESLVHQVVVAYLAGSRQGTKAQKTRAEVSGGGRKPWRQKGTGRARAGTIRSPLWRTGGRTFAAKPRSFDQKVNKKMYRAAIKSILSELIRQDRLVVVEDLDIQEPKTKLLAEKLKSFDAKKLLIITAEVNTNLYLASRNIPNIDVRDLDVIDPVCLVDCDKAVVTEDALKKLEERLGE